MKKVVLGLMAVAISFASIAQTQTEKQKDRRKGENKEFRHKRERGFQDMNLTEAQKSKMKTINESFRDQMKSLQSNKSLSEADMKQKRESLREEHKTQIQALLTAEQRKQWEEKSKQHEFKGKGGKRFDKGQKASRQTK
jgi:Spy/CpxP family protein refolding chaperone